MDGIPAQLGRYRIVRLLATGGMGEVFLARQEGPAGFSRPAVVKRVLAHLAREHDFVQMFLDEARLAGNLAHPNIVQIFELGEADGTWFIAMEYLHGRSLRLVRQQLARTGVKANPVQAARMLSQALDGLQYAHTLAGPDGVPLEVVHRDISPDNVFVGFNGVVKVLDFGIAKAANAISTTRTGIVKGKCAYMPPEQLRGEKLDGRTDVYAAGIVLYELLSGDKPFVGPSDVAVINQVLTAPAAPLQSKAPHVPPALCAMVMKALEKAPEARWQTAGEFSSALERFVASSGEPNTNAATAAYLKELFGEVGPDDPGLTFATPPGRVARQGAPPGTPLPLLTEWDAAPPQRLAEHDLFGTVEDELAAPPAPAAAESSPAPAVPLEPERPEPRVLPLAVEPVSQRLELDRPAPVPDPPLPVPTPDLALAASPERAATRRWPLIAVAVAVIAGVAAVGLSGWYPSNSVAMKVPDVAIHSEPSGASLRIGDDQVGKTPWTGSNVWTGEVAFELSAPGYLDKRGTFRGGEPVQLNVKLRKK
ncbi:MAG: Serine/threonine protein kinase [Myxococcaceae bacterium]|nr:Serine/threonine protein kinase [Myxococcaceae bacterium]